MFSSHRMDLAYDNKTEDKIWSYRIVKSLSQLQQQGGLQIFMIFQSYYYQRVHKKWLIRGSNNLPNLQGKQFDDLKKLTKYLDENDIVYQIVKSQSNGSDNEENVQVISNGKKDEFPRDRDFVYEITDDIKGQTVFIVELVIKGKGRYKMKSDKNRKFWTVSVSLLFSELKNLEYWF